MPRKSLAMENMAC